MSDDDSQGRFVKQVFDLWINPEVERRRQLGTLATPFQLRTAQVVVNLDQPHVVRLNDEVKAVMMVKVQDQAKLDMGPGKPVYWDQIEDITDIHLTDQDPNAGHVTLVGAPDGRWLVVFDFRYNAERVGQVVLAAEEFLNASSFAAKQGYARAFAENLFAATELAAKARLLLMPEPVMLSAKSHRFIAQKANLHGRWGNVDPAFVKLLNELGAARGDARYVQGVVSFTPEEMEEMLRVVRDALEIVKAQTPKRVPTKPAANSSP